MTDLVGKRIHSYTILRQLGCGGMGEVFEVEHVDTGERCALKLMHAEVAKTPDHRRRFLREARAARAVEHDNIVRIHDIFEHEGIPALTMELLVGHSLEQELAVKRRLSLGEVARHLIPIVSAVGHAHAVGIVHRDLKPDNIFLTTSGSSMLLDFGIVKLTHSDGAAAATQALTRTGFVVGTPFYMSPEQACGEKLIDHRADIWSLGIILYRCLSGVIPTASASFPGIFSKIVALPIAPLDVRELGLPIEIGALITKMLQKKPHDRPSDLREVFELLMPHADVSVPAFASAVEPRPCDDSIPTPAGAVPGANASPVRTAGIDGTLVMARTTANPVSSAAPERTLALAAAERTMVLGVDSEPQSRAQAQPSFGGSTNAAVELPKNGNAVTIALIAIGLVAIAAIAVLLIH